MRKRKRKAAKIDLKSALGVYSVAEYATMRGVTEKTLSAERCNGKGPPFQKFGRHVQYPIEGVHEFHAASTVKPQDRAQEIARRRKAKRDAQATQDSSAAVSPP
jgi:hypothetical protein